MAMTWNPEEVVRDRNDLLELAWGIIANAGGSDWTKETEEWQEAAKRWREKYFSTLPIHNNPT